MEKPKTSFSGPEFKSSTVEDCNGKKSQLQNQHTGSVKAYLRMSQAKWVILNRRLLHEGSDCRRAAIPPEHLQQSAEAAHAKRSPAHLMRYIKVPCTEIPSVPPTLQRPKRSTGANRYKIPKRVPAVKPIKEVPTYN